MNKVLIITYYWPPSGGAAVQRWLSFANNLAEAGIKVHVLTVHEHFATYQLSDESLQAKIHKAITVHKTKTVEPFTIYKRLFGNNSIPKPAFSNESNPSFLKKAARFIRGNLFIPDPRKGWRKFAVAKALSIIDQYQIDKVITAGPPHSTHLIGRDLKTKAGIHWIADFHDLWTDVIYYNMLYHLPWVKRIDLDLERMILESADSIITVGEKYKQKLLSKSEKIRTNKITVLPIGYEDTIIDSSLSKSASQEFVITYTGTIGDFYEPQVFINALKNVRTKFPGIPIRLRFVGVLATGIKENIIAAGLGAILDEVGYVPHEQSIEFLYQSTVLLLVNPVTKDEAMVIPGKVYEYMAVRKPIINITRTNAETASIIEGCGSGRTFDRTMQQQLEEYLEELIIEWQKSQSLPALDNEGCVLRYSRFELTKKLMQLLTNDHNIIS